ncbi:MAG TPA: cysteine synthase A [Clostridia bacterium]|nr:cysteine synthase A [Clostridia bacterium]
MARIAQSLAELVGNTPLIELNNFCRARALKGNILAKLEYFNPSSSAKDRVAQKILDDAEKNNLISQGGTVIEATSGDTGIALACICAVKNYRLILTMPESVGLERRKLLAQLGAEVVLTEREKGIKGAIDKAYEIFEKTENAFMPKQFENPSNPAAHETTAKEIISDTDKEVAYLVAGMGTGGTITGTGKALKREIPDIKIVGVEPTLSPLISKGYSGHHGIIGIGSNFIPGILDVELLDEIITVTLEEAIGTARAIAKEEGILVGISSGAAAFAAMKIAEREEAAGKNIVVILPNNGERYLSSRLFD